MTATNPRQDTMYSVQRTLCTEVLIILALYFRSPFSRAPHGLNLEDRHFVEDVGDRYLGKVVGSAAPTLTT